MRPLLLLLMACEGSERRACEDLCGTLANQCAFAAYPDEASCLEGCAYEASEGVALGEYHTCVAEAECDVFRVVSCARAYGAP